MKLSFDDETLAENKVIILYLLNKVSKPFCNEALYKLVYSVTDMNYFYFQQFLLDLLGNEYIINYTLQEDSVYEITSKGRDALEVTENLIPGIIKFRIDTNFKENLDIIEEEFSITADYIPESENEFSVKCKIVENSKTIFELRTFAGSREQAKSIVDRWKENATEIYPKLLDILSKDI